ncbi:MAG: HAMP domain-containing sensor histidine kinase [Chloroflexi bacterium]|nr:HAMP domain-containing sensor histidine kinase [Chloroflexota bacterium]MDA1147290.1 HAMP domain-containing sensor histidine kinase [Chloroflexota bacterium]
MTSSTALPRAANQPRPPSSGGGKLAAAAIIAAIGVLGVNAAVLYGVLERVDARIFAVQVFVTLLLLIAALLHFRQLARERRRFALTTILADLAAEPSGIQVTAQQALDALVANQVAVVALVALADDDDSEGEMRPVATHGYPHGWLAEARPRALPAPNAYIEFGRDDDHPWVTVIADAVGGRPWVARIPLRSAANPFGVLLLAARKPGLLEDELLLERLGAQLATALDHAAMYEAAYDREQRLEALDVRRRDFIAALAHEVRTPLTSIQAFADLLHLQPVAMDETAEQLVSSLTQGVQRLRLLVDDLRYLGQSQSIGFTVSPTAVSVPALFTAIETLLRPAYLLREQTLAIEIAEGATVIRADQQRLEQVLLNLLVNANRYTPLRGPVSLRAVANDSVIRIEVDDSGEGIPANLRERIFDPYYRVDRSDPAIHGSGLGLAVARQLIALQSGRIWVEDSPTGGARFCVELPRVIERPVVPPLPTPDPEAHAATAVVVNESTDPDTTAESADTVGA